VWDWAGEASRMRWQDGNGSTLPHQLLHEGRDEYWGHLHTDALVKVKVPAMGYSTVVLDEAKPETIDLNVSQPRVSQPFTCVMENEFLRAELDIHDGFVVSLTDKETGMEYVKPGQPLGIFRLIEEDTAWGMSAWTVGRHMNTRILNQGVRFKDTKTGPQYLR